jgi:thiamine-phosphate pyrophosphorylase
MRAKVDEERRLRIVVISPPDDRADERALCCALFEAGVERYHLRKPAWTEAVTAAWLESLPEAWRRRVVLHTHHGLARELGAGGVHFRDDGAAPDAAATFVGFTSRSCHDVTGVQAALGRHHAVLMGPLFPSHSKPGYGPLPSRARDELRTLLVTRTQAQRTTEVIAIGGISAAVLNQCAALGFDGAAVLGALWDAPDPVAAFLDLGATAAAITTAHTERRASP